MQVETEGSLELSESEKSEQLDIILNEKLKYDEVEGIGSEILTDLEVEQKIEDFFHEEDECEHSGHEKAKIVGCAANEEVIFACYFEICWVRLGVV